MWDSILEVLEEKAAQGVEVKMLYDDIGCMVTLPGDYTDFICVLKGLMLINLIR